MAIARLVKKPMPQRSIDYLRKVGGIAMSNLRYRWAIDIFGRYYKKFEFNENQTYKFALLCDHLAMRSTGRIKSRHLAKAKLLYEKILKKNPAYFHALYGIGRIYDVRGDYKQALKFQIKAYRQMMKLPKKERGALAIGHIYQSLGDIKNAEKWYLKEYHDTPKSDFGTPLNLFRFYKRIGNYKKALRWALATEKLIDREYKKPVYKGMNMQNSGWVLDIKKDIEAIKKGG